MNSHEGGQLRLLTNQKILTFGETYLFVGGWSTRAQGGGNGKEGEGIEGVNCLGVVCSDVGGGGGRLS